MMADIGPAGPVLRLARRVVRLTSSIVPAGYRAKWRREWFAELDCRALDHERNIAPRRGRLELLVRSLGAVPDALWLRRQEWSLDMLGHDFRQAFRSIMTRRALAGVAVLTMGLGIGGSTAIFSVVNPSS